MRPAVRFPDGHVEIVQEMAAESQSSNDDVWTQFHEAGFTDLWYAHPGPHPYVHYQRGGPRDRFGPRWHAGVVTGPKHDLVCVRACATREEANRCLSPSGWTPEEAVKLALAKRAELGEKP